MKAEFSFVDVDTEGEVILREKEMVLDWPKTAKSLACTIRGRYDEKHAVWEGEDVTPDDQRRVKAAWARIAPSLFAGIWIDEWGEESPFMFRTFKRELSQEGSAS